MANAVHLPAAALRWLTGADGRLLTVGVPRSALAAVSTERSAIVLSPQEDATGLAARFPQATVIAAAPDALPLQPCSVSTILVGTRPVDDLVAVQRQMSRTLEPGGWVAGWTIRRDDSVPWVRRLRELMQSLDPDAMNANVDTDPWHFAASKYFPRFDQREFRLWVPMPERQLRDSIAHQPAIAALGEAERNRVHELTHEILAGAGGFGTLRLPYQVLCWRAMVDHEELTQPIQFSDGALVIPI